jgi:hypothetical protein
VCWKSAERWKSVEKISKERKLVLEIGGALVRIYDRCFDRTDDRTVVMMVQDGCSDALRTVGGRCWDGSGRWFRRRVVLMVILRLAVIVVVVMDAAAD